MESLSNAMDYASEMVRKGQCTSAEANVEVVRMIGVREITNSIPRDIRTALNAAVKAGRLGHIKKDGLMPECYFHPNSRNVAMELRNRRVNEKTDSLRKVFQIGTPNSLDDDV